MRLALLLLLAQTPALRDSTPEGPTCWRGRPLPHCESFWITDFTYGRRIFRGGDANAFGDTFLTWDVGGMVNYGSRHAFGAAMVKSIGSERDYFGIRPRYRRWLGGESSLDLSVGILLSGHHDVYRARFPSFTAHVTLSEGDLLGLTAGVEAIRGGPVRWQGGARFGSYSAIPATLVVFMILLAQLGSGGT